MCNFRPILDLMALHQDLGSDEDVRGPNSQISYVAWWPAGLSRVQAVLNSEAMPTANPDASDDCCHHASATSLRWSRATDGHKETIRRTNTAGMASGVRMCRACAPNTSCRQHLCNPQLLRVDGRRTRERCHACSTPGSAHAIRAPAAERPASAAQAHRTISEFDGTSPSSRLRCRLR